MKHRCPICKKVVKESAKKQSEEAEFFPFCSERCKLVDLGAWLDADYRIISELHSQETGEPSTTSSDTAADKQ